MANKRVKEMAMSFIRQLHEAKLPVEEAMEIMTACTLSVATITQIEGTSTNGTMTILMQKGTPESLGIDTNQYTDHKSTMGSQTKH